MSLHHGARNDYDNANDNKALKFNGKKCTAGLRPISEAIFDVTGDHMSKVKT